MTKYLKRSVLSYSVRGYSPSWLEGMVIGGSVVGGAHGTYLLLAETGPEAGHGYNAHLSPDSDPVPPARPHLSKDQKAFQNSAPR